MLVRFSLNFISAPNGHWCGALGGGEVPVVAWDTRVAPEPYGGSFLLSLSVGTEGSSVGSSG